MRTKIRRLALLGVVMGGLLVTGLVGPGERGGDHPDLGERVLRRRGRYRVRRAARGVRRPTPGWS